MGVHLYWIFITFVFGSASAQLQHTGPHTIDKPFRIGLPRLWRQARVPYRFESGKLGPAQQRVIRAAMKTIEEHSCVRFVPATGGKWSKHLLVTSTVSQCAFSDLGVWQPSLLQLSSSCALLPSVVLHELLHVLGFEHEHNRPDRDSHITVNASNIQEGQYVNFQKFRDLFDLRMAYDFASIMHYNQWQQSNGQGPTYECVRRDDCYRNNGTLSELDVERINRLYCAASPRFGLCANRRFDDTRFACCRQKGRLIIASYVNGERPSDEDDVDAECCNRQAYDRNQYKCCWAYDKQNDNWSQTAVPASDRGPCETA